MPIIHNGINGLGVAKYVVSPDPTQGTHTTISAANAVAVSGDQVYIRQGSYTESDSNWVPGVNYFADGNSGAVSASGLYTPTVTITGNQTFTAAGNYYLNGIYFTAPSGNVLTVSGANLVYLTLRQCTIYVGVSGGFGINLSNSALSAVEIFNCQSDLVSGAAHYTSSCPGAINIYYCLWANSGASTVASTNSNGVVSINYSNITSALTTSGSGILNVTRSTIDASGINTTTITTAGTGTNTFITCSLLSGTATALSVGAGTTVSTANIRVVTSNATPITVAGTLNYEPIWFSGAATIGGAGTIIPLQSGPTIYTQGITFQNQALASGDVLQDYISQGTYTPTLTGSTTAGTTTYSQQTGYYTQIGKRIFLDFLIQYTAMTGTGNMQVSLPFTARTSSNGYWFGAVQFVNVTLPTYVVITGASATTSPVFCQITNGQTVMIFGSNRSGAAGANVAAANPATSPGIITGSISYLVT